MTREKFIEELLQLSDIGNQIKALNERFYTFAAKHEKLKYELLITKNCITLHQRITQLEQSAASNAQYHWRESVEVNPVPRDNGDNFLVETVCKAISLTGHEFTPDDIHAYHQLQNEGRVILKLKDRRLKRSI